MNDHKRVRKVGYIDFLKIDPASNLLRKIGQNSFLNRLQIDDVR